MQKIETASGSILCPVCGGSNLFPVFQKKGMPLYNYNTPFAHHSAAYP